MKYLLANALSFNGYLSYFSCCK